MNIQDRLIDDLTRRQALLRADRNKHTFFLKGLNPSDLIAGSLLHLLRGLQKKNALVEVVTQIGRRIRQANRMSQDSVIDAHTGWFILISYFECEVLKYKVEYAYRDGKKSKFQTYFLQVISWPSLTELWALVDKTKLDIQPLKKPADDWVSPIHSSGNTVIKKVSSAAMKRIPDDPQWMMYQVLNKLQHQPWAINKDVFSVFQQCLELPDSDSPFKFAHEKEWQRRKSLRMEVDYIEKIAQCNLNNDFYHLYNFDFRGRVYVTTGFLNEQSSDNAKGLLMFGLAEKLGRDGYRWLRVHTSNCFGNDKETIPNRVKFVDDNFDAFLEFAERPLVNRGWMKADSPFMFLACCFELLKIYRWVESGNSIEEFESQLILYIDGSNNGVQHLAALSLDETVAPLVNLVPSDRPGDAYMYIANFVWERLEEMNAAVPPETVARFDEVFATANRLHAEYAAAPLKSEAKSTAYDAAKEWRNHNRDLRVALFPQYWLRITSPKDRRKIVKRNVMTLGYGGTAYGMGQQIIDDTKDMSDYLRDKEHLWGILLGKLVYDICYEKLPGPAKMLRLFQTLAARFNEKPNGKATVVAISNEDESSRNEDEDGTGIDLCWTAPVTGFPVVQMYRKPTIKRAKLSYGGEELKVNISAWEDSFLNKAAQKTSSAPNIVHSFDAAHLATVVAAAGYPVSVVHDSFGCRAGSMSDLFCLVREKFLLFYAHDPLHMLLQETGSLDLMPERGNLDLDLILQSDFAFI